MRSPWVPWGAISVLLSLHSRLTKCLKANFTPKSIAREVKWRIGSRSNNLSCLATELVRIRLREINCVCGFPLLLMFWWMHCENNVCRQPNYELLKLGRFARNYWSLGHVLLLVPDEFWFLSVVVVRTNISLQLPIGVYRRCPIRVEVLYEVPHTCLNLLRFRFGFVRAWVRHAWFYSHTFFSSVSLGNWKFIYLIKCGFLLRIILFLNLRLWYINKLFVMQVMWMIFSHLWEIRAKYLGFLQVSFAPVFPKVGVIRWWQAFYQRMSLDSEHTIFQQVLSGVFVSKYPPIVPV